MSVPLKLAAFAAVLLVALGTAFGIGRFSEIDGQAAAEEDTHDDEQTASHSDASSEATGHAESHADGGDGDAATVVPGGLQVAAEGYAIELINHAAEPGSDEPFEFRIVGPDGAPVTDFVTAHDADLHLIVVNRDLSDYQHVHPELADNGTWSVPLSFAKAGAYRAFADFTPAGREDGLTLGADVLVDGDYEPATLPAAAHAVEVDGYTVELEGELVPAAASPLTMTVSRDGEPVTDLQPYLGAYGHLVALREGDLAYLHVHPEGDPADPGTEPGPEVSFVAEVPSEGAYRLYFEFRHEDAVHRVEFTAETSHEH